MIQRPVTRAILILAVGAAAWAGAVDREAVVREMLDRSRLLQDVHFNIPLPLWRRYIEETVAGAAAAPEAPVPLIAEEALYHLTVAEDQTATLAVRLRLRVFDPGRVTSAPVLSTSRAWQDVRVNGQPADLLLVGAWLRVVADAAGTYEVAATTPLAAGNAYGGSCELAIPPTVRTLVRFDSPSAWALTAEGAPLTLRGSADAGTHGQLALTARDRLKVAWQPPTALTDRAPRFQLRGAVAWNLDAAVQQVAARLDVAIVGGRADRMVLRLPPTADRVSVTGPDVRETRVEGGAATVHLRGKIAEHTRLDVRYETPHGRGTIQRFGGIEVVGGHWSGGTLVVSNTAGGSEVLAESLVGLRELALSEIPPEAAAILPGPPVLACAIAARQWSAEVDVVDLGEFALRESIADLAHYELSFRGDGTLVCKATYEVRNRTRQFLRLDLPRGATALLARVNEKTRPLTPVPGAADAWLLPLVRSKASVKGLVTFPVEVVYMCRLGPLERRGETALPLPRIDLPIAYAWCEAYVPAGMRVGRWTGPLRKVEQYSSETAKADLGYGRGIAVEGYKGMARPTAAPEPPPPEKKPKPEPTPEPKEKPSKEGEPSPRRRGLGILGWFGARRGAKRAPAETAPATEPEPTAPVEDMPVPVMKPPAAKSKSSFEVSPSLLARNYYRAGRDFYENNDFANAAKNFEKVLELTPKSNEALNASRLLSNIRLAQGKLALKSRAEKAAGAQFQKRQEQLSVKEEQQQVEFLEKGLKAAREGRLSEARAQLEAAGSLGRKLLEQGAGQREQHARLGVIEEKLAEVRDKEAGQAQVLYKEVEKLERAGDYEAALETARKLRNLGEASKQMRDKLLSLAEQTTRQRALQREAPRHEGGRPGRVTTIGGEELTTPKWEAELRETMASKKVSFDFVETPIQDTVAFLAGVTGANFVLDPDAVRDDAPTVTLKVQDMPVGKALDWLCKLANLKHTLRDEAVFISKPDRISDKPVLRMYDVTDLTIDIKDLSGRQRAVAKGKPDDDQETLTGEAVLERIRRTIAPGTWSRGDSKPDGKAGVAPRYTISYRNGRIVVVHQPEVNRQIEDLLANYRKVRGPQVELGGNIARQRAQGQAGKGIVLLTDGRDVSGAATGGGKPSGELRRFIWRNYDWQLRKTAEAQQAPQSAVPKMPDQAWDDLSEKLGSNLGQKVQVSSINLDIPAQAANQLGARFQTGNNGVVFTVVDEAQFRTLVELDSRKNRFGRSVPMNPRGQDTIVGTDALLANAWTANVRFAADRANTIDVNGNPINLAHDQYILIDNGSFLTAVRAGEMQHWTERSAPVQLADVPQDIDVPRVGQMVKFEKTLVEPDDELVLRASYSWKGEGR